jgi:hypothetical protein
MKTIHEKMGGIEFDWVMSVMLWPGPMTNTVTTSLKITGNIKLSQFTVTNNKAFISLETMAMI